MVEGLRYEPAPPTADRIVDLWDAGIRTACAADSLWRYVKPCHHGRVHRREVELADLLVQSHQRLIGQPALVGDDQLTRGLEHFRLTLLPRDEDAVAHSPQQLHRTDRRPCR